MKSFYINRDIDNEIADSLFSEFNKFNDDVEFNIYISSDGGYSHIANCIIDFINNNADKITLIASGFIKSAAFNIFYFSKCNRIILPDTCGMIHYARTGIEISEGGIPYYEENQFALKDIRKSKTYTLNRLKSIGVNDIELDIIKQGKDCYFTNKRLNELLKYGKEKDR